MNIKDHYKTLGVKRNVDESEIRNAFRQLAKKYHPDICGEQQTRRFQEILEAYSVLSNPESRVCYNRSLVKADRPADAGVIRKGVVRPENTARLRPLRPSFFGSPFGQRPPCRAEQIFDLVFEDFPGRGRAGRRIPRQGPLDVEVELSKEEAGRGGILPLPYPGLAPCRSCGGRGLTGGWVCLGCNGRGMEQIQKTVRIKVPAGVADGSTLEVPTGDFGNPGAFLRIRIRVTNTALRSR